jgi:hypothetical protein
LLACYCFTSDMVTAPFQASFNRLSPALTKLANANLNSCIWWLRCFAFMKPPPTTVQLETPFGSPVRSPVSAYKDHFVAVQSAAPGGTPTPFFVPFFTFGDHRPRHVNELPPLILGEGGELSLAERRADQPRCEAVERRCQDSR